MAEFPGLVLMQFSKHVTVMNTCGGKKKSSKNVTTATKSLRLTQDTNWRFLSSGSHSYQLHTQARSPKREVLPPRCIISNSVVDMWMPSPDSEFYQRREKLKKGNPCFGVCIKPDGNYTALQHTTKLFVDRVSIGIRCHLKE
jgi:hypothetical protein